MIEPKVYELEEVTAVRSGCRYVLADREPSFGTWWAVRAVPVTFPPGEHHPLTLDGMPVEEACIIACHRRHDSGRWQWCHLSIAAKRIFGDLVFDAGILAGWVYVVEEVNNGD